MNDDITVTALALVEVLDLGFGVPTRYAQLDKDRGHWENELQADIGQGWERVLTFAPPREKMTAQESYDQGRALALKNGPKFFQPWLERRSTEIANAQARAAEKALKDAQHAAAAPQRAAVLQESFRELGRRADEKAKAADQAAANTPDDPVFRWG